MSEITTTITTTKFEADDFLELLLESDTGLLVGEEVTEEASRDFIRKLDNVDGDTEASSIEDISKHEFSFHWCFWQDSSSKPGENMDAHKFAESQMELGVINSVETFCMEWNKLSKTNRDVFGVYSNLRLFKKGIRPLWEDPSNKKGGRWVIRVKVNLDEGCDTISDEWSRMFLRLLIHMVTGQLSYEDDICGAGITIKPQTLSLSLWNKDSTNTKQIEDVSDRLYEILNPEKVEYWSHADNRSAQLTARKRSARNGKLYNNRRGRQQQTTQGGGTSTSDRTLKRTPSSNNKIHQRGSDKQPSNSDNKKNNGPRSPRQNMKDNRNTSNIIKKPPSRPNIQITVSEASNDTDKTNESTTTDIPPLETNSSSNKSDNNSLYEFVKNSVPGKLNWYEDDDNWANENVLSTLMSHYSPNVDYTNTLENPSSNQQNQATNNTTNSSYNSSGKEIEQQQQKNNTKNRRYRKKVNNKGTPSRSLDSDTIRNRHLPIFKAGTDLGVNNPAQGSYSPTNGVKNKDNNQRIRQRKTNTMKKSASDTSLHQPQTPASPKVYNNVSVLPLPTQNIHQNKRYVKSNVQQQNNNPNQEGPSPRSRGNSLSNLNPNNKTPRNNRKSSPIIPSFNQLPPNRRPDKRKPTQYTSENNTPRSPTSPRSPNTPTSPRTPNTPRSTVIPPPSKSRKIQKTIKDMESKTNEERRRILQQVKQKLSKPTTTTTSSDRNELNVSLNELESEELKELYTHFQQHYPDDWLIDNQTHENYEDVKNEESTKEPVITDELKSSIEDSPNEITSETKPASELKFSEHDPNYIPIHNMSDKSLNAEPETEIVPETIPSISTSEHEALSKKVQESEIDNPETVHSPSESLHETDPKKEEVIHIPHMAVPPITPPTPHQQPQQHAPKKSHNKHNKPYQNKKSPRQNEKKSPRVPIPTTLIETQHNKPSSLYELTPIKLGVLLFSLLVLTWIAFYNQG